MQAAFLIAVIFPPPAPCPFALARIDRAGARLTSNRWVATRMQRIDGDIIGFDGRLDLIR